MTIKQIFLWIVLPAILTPPVLILFCVYLAWCGQFIFNLFGIQ